MPMLNIYNKKVVLPNYDYSNIYWARLSKFIHNQINDKEIKDPSEVQRLLKAGFEQMCLYLKEKIWSEKRASFYIFCKNIHEDSIELWMLQSKNIPLEINEEDFAASRRILKIILEQSTKLKLKGCSNFENEINANINSYTKFLEELIYIGSWCFILSENLARSQLFPDSTGLAIENNVLVIQTYQPYHELFSFIFHEVPKHNSGVVLSDSMIEFKEVINESYGVSYDDLSQFIIQQLIQPKYRFGVSKIDSLIIEIVKDKKVNAEFVNDFYKGLTITKCNSLSIEECFYTNQSEFRHSYRPILELTIDNELYNIIGYHKWLESMYLLSTNSFPYGVLPTEWKRYNNLKSFINRVENTHDYLLVDPIIDILNKKSFINDKDLDSFAQPNNTNINIKQSIGDIDVLFIDEAFKLIYVCECKHSRSRFDVNNWKRDYSKFQSKYEAQLKRKIDWVSSNKDVIQTHFNYTQDTSLNLKDFDIRGIFIINTPTIYMFNGKYRVFTIKSFKDLIERKYVDVKFEFTNEDTGEKIIIEYPYFDNIKLKYNS